MEVAEPKLVCLVDQHRVRVRDVDPAFDDGGRHQHVEGAVDETGHDVFEVLAFHLAVANADPRVGNEALDHARHFLDVADPVVHEVGLPAAAELVSDGVPDDLLVEPGQNGVDGVPVGRRSADDAQVACAHERELERPWNGRGCEGQGVHIGFERFQFVFDAHPKLLFFVDHKQPEVFELHPLPHQGVGAHQDVHLACLQPLQSLCQRLAYLEAVDVIHRHGEVPQPSAEAFEVLHGQDGRGHKHGHLFAVAGGPEGGPDGDFRFPEAHVPANEAVHRCGLQHVFAHGLGGGVLVRGVFVHEAGLQGVLEVAIFGVSMAWCRLALGVELKQVVRDLLDAALGLLLGFRPGVGAELVDFGLGAFLAAVLGNAVEAVDADVEHVASTVSEPDGLLHFSVDFNFVKAAELADAMVDVDHVVAHLQRHQFFDGEGFFVFPEPFFQSETVVALKQLVVRVNEDFQVLVHEALTEFHGDGLVRHGFFPLFQPVVKDVVQALQLGGLATHHHIDIAVAVVGTQVGGNQVKLLVERRLLRHAVFQDDAVGPCRSTPKFHHTERLQQTLKGIA